MRPASRRPSRSTIPTSCATRCCVPSNASSCRTSRLESSRAAGSTRLFAFGPLRLDNTDVQRDALLRAVKRELMSDVPFGIFTSGGLDSSLLVAATSRAVPGERIHTYAVRFTESSYDESAYAEAV